MENNIKNFDRAIEQRMNEQEIQPPFGMWNRISAELDAAPVAETPAVSPIPKRAIGGFIVGAIIIGASVITAYLTNTNSKPFPMQQASPRANAISNNQPETKNIVTVNAPVASNATISEHVQVTNEKEEVKLAPVKKVSTLKTIGVSQIKASDNTKGAVSDEITPVPTQPTDLPVGGVQAFYFPPVDMNVSQEKDIEKTTTADDDDKPVRVAELKIKFHPKKRGKFSYGRINRIKNK